MNELKEKKEHEDYFLGMLILKKESSTNNINKISVVDGQQRITTLFLILKAIEMKLKKESLDNFLQVIKEKKRYI